MRVKASTEFMPRFPVYIYSQSGDSKTAGTLDNMGIPYRIVEDRNRAKQKSLREGHLRHWILDGDIEKIHVLFRNRIFDCFCPSVFHIMETIALGFTNVGMAFPSVMPVTLGKDDSFLMTNAIPSSFILVNNLLNADWEGEYTDKELFYIKALKENRLTIRFPYFAFTKARKPPSKNLDVRVRAKTRTRMNVLMRRYPRYFSVVRKLEGWEYVLN